MILENFSLEVLDVTYELGADTAYNSIQTLLRISPDDLSADKIKAVSGDFKIEYNTITSQEYSPPGKESRMVSVIMTALCPQ